MRTDPALWTDSYDIARAGRVVRLTQEGRERAFAVGAQVRHGAPVRALLALVGAGGSGALTRRAGSRLYLTDLGRLGALVWGYLGELGLTVRSGEQHHEIVQLTDAGRAAVARGYAEQESLLERCRRAAASELKGNQP